MEQLILLIYVLIGIILIFEMVCMWITYKKVGAPGWAIFIPIYNYIALFKIANIPTWMILLLFIPVINLYPLYLIYTAVAEHLGKSRGYGILLLIAPYFAYPILAFSKPQVEQVYVNSEPLVSNQSLMTGPIAPLGAQPDSIEETISKTPTPVGDPNMEEMKTEEGRNETSVNNMSYNMMEPDLQPLEPVVPIEVENPLTAQQKVQHVEEPKEIYPDVNVYRTCPNCGTKLEPNVSVCFLCGKRLDE
jgi:hypothetical protein